MCYRNHWYLCPPDPPSHFVPHSCNLGSQQFGKLESEFEFVLIISNFLNGLTRGLFNLCENSSLITASSTSGVKYIGLPVIGSSIFHIEANAKLNVEYIEIYSTIFQHP